MFNNAINVSIKDIKNYKIYKNVIISTKMCCIIN